MKSKWALGFPPPFTQNPIKEMLREIIDKKLREGRQVPLVTILSYLKSFARG